MADGPAKTNVAARFLWILCGIVLAGGASGFVVQVSTNAATANELKHVNDGIARMERGIEGTQYRMQLLEDRVRALEIAVGKQGVGP